MNYEPTTNDRRPQLRCHHPSCQEQAVVTVPADERWSARLRCFRHAFIHALTFDEEARRLAIGAAAAYVLSDQHVERGRRARRNGR